MEEDADKKYHPDEIRVGFEFNPVSFRILHRKKFGKPEYINQIFDCEIDFLIEKSTRHVFLPQKWFAELAPGPEEYYIHEKEWPEIEGDTLEDHEYRGSVIIVADNVSPAVDSQALRQWLLMGLDDDNPEFVAATMGTEEATKELTKIEQILEALPTMPINANTEEEESIVRKQRGAELNKKKGELENKLSAFHQRLEHFKKLRESPMHSPFGIYLIDRKPPLGLKTWEIRPRGDAQSARLAYIATHKYNWTEFRLAVHKLGGEKPKVTKSLWTEPLPASFQEVNMRGVTIARRRHGKGMYRFGDGRGVYSGQWFNNMRHGVGSHLDVSGKFMGSFERDWKVKKGVKIYSHGDTYAGDWGHEANHTRPSMIYGKEYNDGVAHGVGKIKFTDGAEYDGMFENGYPKGVGKYTSATGEVVEGKFGDFGSIDGQGSQRDKDATLMGHFRTGLLEGRGLNIDTYTGRYSGFFRMGLPHTAGEEDIAVISGRYTGFFSYGLREERGVLNFGSIGKDQTGTSKTPNKESLRLARPGNCIQLPEPPLQRPYTLSSVKKGLSIGSTYGPQTESKCTEKEESDSDQDQDDVNTAGACIDEEQSEHSSESSDVWDISDASNTSEDEGSERKKATGNALDELDKMLDIEQVVSKLTGMKKRKRRKHKRKLGKYNQYDHYDIPYEGDYMFEGEWRGGAPRNGGVFTFRQRRTAPHAHNRYFVHHKKNVHLPGLPELLEKQETLVRGRAKAKTSEYKRIWNIRKNKEKENLKSYEYWTKVARDNIPKVQEENRRRHRGVEMLRESLIGEQAQEKWEEMADLSRFVEPYEEEKHGPVANVDISDLMGDHGIDEDDDEANENGYSSLMAQVNAGEVTENEELGNDL